MMYDTHYCDRIRLKYVAEQFGDLESCAAYHDAMNLATSMISRIKQSDVTIIQTCLDMIALFIAFKIECIQFESPISMKQMTNILYIKYKDVLKLELKMLSELDWRLYQDETMTTGHDAGNYYDNF